MKIDKNRKKKLELFFDYNEEQFLYDFLFIIFDETIAEAIWSNNFDGKN